MKKLLVLISVLAALVLAGAAVAALRPTQWTVLGSDNEPAGTVAIAYGHADNPVGLRVYIGGIGVGGYGHVNCDVNQVHKTTVTDYTGSGYHTLNMPYAHPTDCNIYATAGSDQTAHSVRIEANE